MIGYYQSEFLIYNDSCFDYLCSVFNSRTIKVDETVGKEREALYGSIMFIAVMATKSAEQTSLICHMNSTLRA